MSTDSPERLVEIGVVGRPHGVDGEIRIYLHNPESTDLLSTRYVYLDMGKGPENRVIANLRESASCIVGSIEGCSSRTDAEEIKGAKILVARKDLPNLEEDEFYVDDLIGLEAWDGASFLGKVEASRRQADVEFVTIIDDEVEIGIPFVDDFVVDIEVAKGRILFRDTDRLPRATIRRKNK